MTGFHGLPCCQSNAEGHPACWAVRTGSRAVWVTPASQRENPKENEPCFRGCVFRSRNPSVVSNCKNWHKIKHTSVHFSTIFNSNFTEEIPRNHAKRFFHPRAGRSTSFPHKMHYVSPHHIQHGVHDSKPPVQGIPVCCLICKNLERCNYIICVVSRLLNKPNGLRFENMTSALVLTISKDNSSVTS